MSGRKYKQGRQICSISEFDQSEKRFFIVRFGKTQKTTHRSFLISWQYRTLMNFIIRGDVFEAEVK